MDSSASTAALLVESLVSPLSQELADGDTLSEQAVRALDEIFANTAIGDRIVSFKIWKDGGLVVYASDRDIVGIALRGIRRLSNAPGPEPSPATLEGLDDAESAAEAELGLPLLEVYSPVREAWSGEVIAVAEFYEVATACATTWPTPGWEAGSLVSGAFLTSGLLLSGIVRSGGRTIERQKSQLRAQVAESRDFARQNAELRLRAIGAAARATAQAEKNLRRVSADLHDGPAQYVALAAMRLDAIVPDSQAAREEAAAVGKALQSALSEIRAISRGLSLPDLDSLGLERSPARGRGACRTRRLRTSPSNDLGSTLPSPSPIPPRSASTASCRRRCRTPPATPKAPPCACGSRPPTRTLQRLGRPMTARVSIPPHRRGIGPDGGQGLDGSARPGREPRRQVRHRDRPGRGNYPDAHLADHHGRDPMTLRIIVADDHPIFRYGLVRSLEEGGFEVVGERGDADEAVALAREHAPDLALLDISMPGDGIEAARRIRAEAPSGARRDADRLRGRGERRPTRWRPEPSATFSRGCRPRS